MAWYNDILGTGANIFGAGPSDSLDVYKNTPGLLPDPDMQKAQKQSLVRGLLGTAVSYLSQPKNQGYGSALPYLGKAFQVGMQEAQKPYDNLENAAKARQALNTAKLQDQYIQSQTMKNIADAKGAGVPKSRLITQAELDANTFGPLPKQENGKDAVWYLVDGKPVNVAKPSSPLVDMTDSAAQHQQKASIDYINTEGKRVGDLANKTMNLFHAADLADLAKTGWGSKWKATIGNMAQTFGINIEGTEDKDYINALNAMQIKNAMDNKPAGSGAMSDNDMKQYLATTMSAENPALTNQIIAYIEEQNMIAEQKYLDALREEGRVNGYGDNVTGFRAKWMYEYRKSIKKQIREDIQKMHNDAILGDRTLTPNPKADEIIGKPKRVNNSDVPTLD